MHALTSTQARIVLLRRAYSYVLAQYLITGLPVPARDIMDYFKLSMGKTQSITRFLESWNLIKSSEYGFVPVPLGVTTEDARRQAYQEVYRNEWPSE